MKKTFNLHPLSQQTKRMLLGILCAISVSQIFGYDFEVDGIYYNKKSSTEVEVTYKNHYTGKVEIPEKIVYNNITYIVTSIDKKAFLRCSGLTEVTIGESVTCIGEYAFYDCSGLIKVTIPNNVTSIGQSAFEKCSGLTEVTIGESVTCIGEYAFYDCSGLIKVTIPNNVTSIGQSAFYNCSGLTEVTIADGTKTLLFGTSETPTFSKCPLKRLYLGRDVNYNNSYSPFRNNKTLASVTIGNSVTSIASSAFSGCSGLTEVTIVDGIETLSFSTSSSSAPFSDCPLETLYLGRDISYNYSPFSSKITLTSVTIGNSVTSIGPSAFKGCSGLTSVTIGNSVTSIGQSAFSGCSGLTAVTIPNSVTSIGEKAFSGCSGLTEVTIGNSVTSIGNYAFEGCSGLTSVTIGNSVTSIGEKAFSGCNGLTSVTIGNSVTSIGNYAFEGCSGLTSVAIGNSVTSIGQSAFSGCSGLTAVTIPNSVTSIGEKAFSGCSGLTSVTIGNSVTSIGYQAFSGCSGLTSVTIGNSVTSIGESAFSGCSGLIEVTIPNSVTSIGEKAFAGCSKLTEVTLNCKEANSWFAGMTSIKKVVLGEDVTSIRYYAFYGCNGLTSVTIGNSVTSIGYQAFSGCSGLTEVTIPNSVTSIGEKAFSGCSGLTTVTIVDGTETLSLDTSSSSTPFSDCPLETLYLGRDVSFSDSPFRDKKTLTSVTIGNSVTSIGYSAFSRCNGLTSVTIGNSVTSIGDYAFYNCSGLTEVTIPNSVTSIGKGACEGCSGLTSVTIGNSVTSIGYQAFSRCSGLTEVTIPNSVIEIGSSAFQNCSGLTAVVIPNSVTCIGSLAFQDCSGLISVTIGNNVTSIGNYAFSGCSRLTTLTIVDGTEPLSFSTSSSSTPFSNCPLETLYLGRDVSFSDSPFRDKKTLTSVTIGNSVASIDNSAFYGCSGIISVTIGNSVASIGNSAFYGCSGLTEVTIPNSVASIGNSAFYGCSGLTEVTIGESVTLIGSQAFSGCSGLTTVTIVDGTEPLSFSTSSSSTPFSYCPLETLYLGREVNYNYSYSPFKNNTNLTSVTIGNSVTSIGSSAFSGCSGLTAVTIPNSVTSISAQAFLGCSGLTLVTIGNCVTSIGPSAFNSCSGLTEVTIPNSVTSIGYGAFYECSRLTKVTIVDGTETLSFDRNSFSNCPLEALYLGRDVNYSNTYSPFKDNTNLTSVTIGESVTSIGSSAFSGCSGLIIKSLAQTPPTIEQSIDAVSLEVPLGCCHAYINAENWNVIDSIYTMDNNTKLYPISLHVEGEKVVSINGIVNENWEVPEKTKIEIVLQEELAQYSMITKGDFDISEDIKDKGSYSFLSSPLYKDNVIRTYAYETSEVHIATAGTLLDQIGIENVENIYSLKVSGSLNGTDILTIRKMTNLKILDMKDAKIVNGGQSYYKDYITSKDAIGDYFFKDKSNLRKVMLPRTAKEIKSYAFADCLKLQSMIIPNSVTSIGSSAFSGCSGLTSLIIEDGNATLSLSPLGGETLKMLYLGRNISFSPFGFNANLKFLTISDSVTSICFQAFIDCSELTSITIPNSVTSVGMYAFAGCSGLTDVTIGSSVTSIGYGAFRDCSGLTEVTIPNSVTSIGSVAFDGCNELRTVTIVDGLETLSFDTSSNYTIFSDCPLENLYLGRNISYSYKRNSTTYYHSPFKDKVSLVSLTIGESVTSIGSSAFSGCSGLTEVIIPNSVTSIGSSAFYGCSGLVEATIGESVTSIGSSAFSGCSGLTEVIIPNSVTSIGSSAFQDCSGLTEVVIPNSITSISGQTFLGCSRLTAVIIPNSVTSIGGQAFSDCNGLTSMTIGNSVTSIGNYAFSGCSGLTAITIPNSVTSIGNYTFMNCSGLVEATIGNGVTSIGNYTFSGCSGLTEVTLGNSITSIGNYAFKGCGILDFVTSLNTTPPEITESTFDETTEKNAKLNVPIGSKTLYWLHPYWENFTDIEEIEVHEDISEKQVEALAIYDSGMTLCEEFAQMKVDYDSVYEQLQKQTAENEQLQSEIETKADEIRKTIEDSTLSEDDKQKFISLLEDILSVQEMDAKKRMEWQSEEEAFNIDKSIFTDYLSRLNGYKLSIESATTMKEIESLISTMNEDHAFVMGEYESAKKHYTELTEELEAAKERGDEMNTMLQELEKLDEQIEDEVEKQAIISKKRSEALATYNDAMGVYETFMDYQKEEKTLVYNKANVKQNENDETANSILAEIDNLKGEVGTAELSDDEKTAFNNQLNEIRNSVSFLKTENDSYHIAFMEEIEKNKDSFTAYSEKLLQDKDNINNATTNKMLDSLIAVITSDMTTVQEDNLKPVDEAYNTMLQISQRLSEISDELNSYQKQFGTLSDDVGIIIKGVEAVIAEKQNNATILYNDGKALYDEYVKADADCRSIAQPLAEEKAQNTELGVSINKAITELRGLISDSGLLEGDKDIFYEVLDSIDEAQQELVEKSNEYKLETFNDFSEKNQTVFATYLERMNGYKERINSSTTLADINSLISTMNDDIDNTKLLYLQPYETYHALLVDDSNVCKSCEEDLRKLLQRLESLSLNFDTIVTDIEQIQLSNDEVIVYTIVGKMKIINREQIQSLPKGVYIIEGKKVFVK